MPNQKPPPSFDEAMAALDEVSQPRQPDTSSADRVRTTDAKTRFAEAANSRLPSVEGFAEMASHPIDSVKKMTGISGVEEGVSLIKKGQYKEGIHAILTGNPIYQIPAEIASTVGEKIGEGDTAGAWGVGLGEGINTALGMGGGRVTAAPVTGPAKAIGVRLEQRALMPTGSLKKNPALKRQMYEAADQRIRPNERGMARADRMVDRAMEPIEMQHAIAGDSTRIATGKVDEAASLYSDGSRVGREPVMSHGETIAAPNASKAKPMYGLATEPGLRGKIEARADEFARVKHEYADPAEKLAAKSRVADSINAYHSVTKNPRYQPLTADDISDATLQQIDYPSSMTLNDLRAYKQQIRAGYTDSKGKLIIDSVQDAYASEVANAVNETIWGAFPSLKEAGIKASDAIDIRKMVGDRIAGVGNLTFGGLPGAISIGHARVVPWLTSTIIENPVFKSRLATAFVKTHKYGATAADAFGRLAAVSAELKTQNDMEIRESSAANAKY